MSLFTQAVVNIERFQLKELNGTLPLVEVSRKYERYMWMVVAFGLFVFTALALFIYNQAVWLHEYHLERFRQYPRLGHPGDSPFGFIFYSFLAFIGLFVVVPTGIAIHGFLMAAVEDRPELRKRKAAADSIADQEKAAAAAERARQQVALSVEADRRQQAIFEFRGNALKQMESGIKQVLYDRRKREEWIPESADEEHLYELIRKRIKQTGVPEFGILRRSTDMVVLMVLGDRSCLPPEPTDELLARRQLPPVQQLLG